MDLIDRIAIFLLQVLDGLLDLVTLRTWSRLRGNETVRYQLKGVDHE